MGSLVNSEMEGMWKEAVVTSFEVLSRQFSLGMGKPTKSVVGSLD